jgi:hypothetical protein
MQAESGRVVALCDRVAQKCRRPPSPQMTYPMPMASQRFSRLLSASDTTGIREKPSILKGMAA